MKTNEKAAEKRIDSKAVAAQARALLLGNVTRANVQLAIETARVHECVALVLGGDGDPAFWDAVRCALVDVLREICREPDKLRAPEPTR